MPNENPVSNTSDKKKKYLSVSGDASRTFYAVALFTLIVMLATI